MVYAYAEHHTSSAQGLAWGIHRQLSEVALEHMYVSAAEVLQLSLRCIMSFGLRHIKMAPLRWRMHRARRLMGVQECRERAAQSTHYALFGGRRLLIAHAPETLSLLPHWASARVQHVRKASSTRFVEDGDC